mgnify:CR=1 FL=1
MSISNLLERQQCKEWYAALVLDASNKVASQGPQWTYDYSSFHQFSRRFLDFNDLFVRNAMRSKMSDLLKILSENPQKLLSLRFCDLASIFDFESQNE